MAAKFQPWYLSLMLSLPACTLRSMQAGGKGLDHLLMDYATELGVPQQSLESYDTIFKIMGKDPLEKQVEYLSLGALPDDVATDAIVTTFAGYFEENTAEMIEFGRVLSHRHIDLPRAELDGLIDGFYDALLDQRNLAWIPVIMNAPDGLTVVAAGAGHLPGKNGVLNLLAQNGYALERMPF